MCEDEVMGRNRWVVVRLKVEVLYWEVVCKGDVGMKEEKWYGG